MLTGEDHDQCNDGLDAEWFGDIDINTNLHKYTCTQIHKYKEKRTSPIQYSHHRDNILARRTKIGFDKSSMCSPVTHSYKQESDEDGKKDIFLAGLILPPSPLSQNFL